MHPAIVHAARPVGKRIRFRCARPRRRATIGLVGVVLWWPGTVGAMLLPLAVGAFGVIEYVNYFVVRLSYPVGRWLTTIGQWRTPQLVQDLRGTAPECSAQ